MSSTHDDAAARLLHRFRLPDNTAGLDPLPQRTTVPGDAGQSLQGQGTPDPADPEELVPQPLPAAGLGDEAWCTPPRSPRRLEARWVAALLLVVGLLAAAGWKFLPAASRSVLSQTAPASQASPLGSLPSSSPSASAQASLSPSAWPSSAGQGVGGSVVVDISGAVRKPGVYSLSAGQRIADAVAAAGGLAEDADPSRLNQAQPVTDAQKIHVARKGEAAPDTGQPAAGQASAGEQPKSVLVQVNRASAAELQKLPKIGPVLAQRILEYRTQHGPFRSLEDLGKVKGCGPAVLASIADHVAFDS